MALEEIYRLAVSQKVKFTSAFIYNLQVDDPHEKVEKEIPEEENLSISETHKLEQHRKELDEKISKMEDNLKNSKDWYQR